MSFLRSSIAITIVLAAHALGIFGLYWIYLWYDIPVHFLGGVAAGVLALDIWHFTVVDVQMRSVWMRPWMIRILFVVGTASLIGVGWELHEFLLDAWRDGGFTRQPSLADTMMDFTMDLLGALVAYGIFAGTYRKT